MPHAQPASGRIYDCNRPMLLALGASLGATPCDLGVAGDTHGALEAALEAALAGPKAVDALVWSVMPPRDPADLDKLRDLSPKVVRALEHGLRLRLGRVAHLCRLFLQPV